MQQCPPPKSVRSRPTKVVARLWALARHPFSPELRKAYREHLRTLPLPGTGSHGLVLFDGAAPEVLRHSMLVRGASVPPLVSIIIPAHNYLEFTLRCLMSITAHTSEASAEIIVCDDGSQDDTPRVLGDVPGLRYLRNEANVGFLHSCNRAAEEAHGEYLLFLNNDTQVQEGWLDHMLALYQGDEHAGLVGAKLVFPDGRLQEAGGIIWRDGSGQHIGRYDDPGKPEYNCVREVDYCSGACLLIKSALFRQLGGFDDRYAPAYYEDADLAFRVRQVGRKVLYQPRAVVVHNEGTSHGTDTRRGIKAYQVANQAKFVERWRTELKEFHFPKPD